MGRDDCQTPRLLSIDTASSLMDSLPSLQAALASEASTSRSRHRSSIDVSATDDGGDPATESSSSTPQDARAGRISIGSTSKLTSRTSKKGKARQEAEQEEASESETPSRRVKRARVGARASIACGTCRKRKVRCSGDWPVCAFCTNRRLPCVYEGHPAEMGGSVNPNSAASLASLFPLTPIEPILPPIDIMLEALEPFFLHLYDTFYFLHRVTLTESIRNGTAPKELVCCILAFAGRFCQSLRDQHPSSPNAASEHYAALAAQVLTQPPEASASPLLDADISLTRCQSYLLLGLWECTEGLENRGWLHVGTAVRMAQILRLGFQDEDEPSTSRSKLDPVQAEVRRRTFWACFLLDRTITDGKERPSSLRAPLSSSLRMPGADSDFNVGRKSVGARFDLDLPPWHQSAARLETLNPTRPEPEADLYGWTLRIAEIWKGVVTYVGSGGRNWDRRPPWLPDSTFAELDKKIKRFEKSLSGVYAYSSANLVAHTMIGQGRAFGMLHLLLACSRLVLHRDYLPFLPPPDYQAGYGPVDGEPLYGDMLPPPGWWDSSMNEASVAAGVISELSTSLAQHGSQITHPFAGFAAVAAGTLHAHLKHWPKSNVRQIDAAFFLEQDITILRDLRAIYPLANSWCEGVQRLNMLYANLVRGVLDSDPSKVRASVIKLLRTARDEDSSASPARSVSSYTSGTGPSAVPMEAASRVFDSNQFAHLDPPEQELLNGDYSLDLSLLDASNDFWSGWGGMMSFTSGGEAMSWS